MIVQRFLAAAAVATIVGFGPSHAASVLPVPLIDGASLMSLDTTVENIGGDTFFVAGLIDMFDDGAGGSPTLPYDFTITGFLADVMSGGLELNVFANAGDVDAVLFGRSFAIAATPGVIEIGFDVETDLTGLFGTTVLALLLEGTDPFADAPLTTEFSAAGASAQITAAAAIPVPAALPMLAIALGMLGVAGRRRR